MHWLDIVVIVLLVLFALYGLSKGFMSSLLSLINVLVSFVAAIFLAKPLATFINNATNWGGKLCEAISNKLATVGNLGKALEVATPASQVIEESAGFTGFFKWLMPKLVGDGTIAAGVTPASYFGNYLGSLCLIVICGIVIFILIRIVVALLQLLFKKLRTNSIIGSVDKILGFIFGAVKGFVAVCIIIFTVGFIPVANTKFNEAVNKTVVTKGLSNGVEAVTEWISKNVDFKKLVQGLLPDKQKENEGEKPETPETPTPEETPETPVTNPVMVTFGENSIPLELLLEK